MNTLPLAVILQQPSPEIEQSQTEHSFAPLHFSKQIMLIPEKPIQIHAATPITPTTREHSTFANKKFSEMPVCGAGSTFLATSGSWLQSFAGYLFEGNIKARLSQRFQKASRANQKGTVTAKGTSGLPMMDDKKEGRQRRRKREREAGGREREKQDRRANREITGERGELMWKVSLIRWNVCPLPQIPSCGAGKKKKKDQSWWVWGELSA